MKNTYENLAMSQTLIRAPARASLLAEVIERLGESGYQNAVRIKQLMYSFFAVLARQYVNEVRISHAKFFLECGEISVGEIADCCGFADFNYFSRKFKELVGMTPRSTEGASPDSTELVGMKIKMAIQQSEYTT